MKSKKIVSLLLTTVLALSAFTGCGSSAGSSSKSTSSKSLSLTVYAGIDEDAALGLTKQFQSDTGIKTNMVRMSGVKYLQE